VAAGGIALAVVGGTGLTAMAAPASAHNVAHAVRSVKFTGNYKGTAQLLIDNGVVTISSVKGNGTGTVVGKSTVMGKGSASASAQCDPFTGTGFIQGPKAKINFKVLQSKSSGCSSGLSGAVKVAFHGVAQATGGTGAGAGASGTLSFKGTLALGGTSGKQAGSYTVALTGTLQLKG
jgi:hypothetical protein